MCPEEKLTEQSLWICLRGRLLIKNKMFYFQWKINSLLNCLTSVSVYQAHGSVPCHMIPTQRGEQQFCVVPFLCWVCFAGSRFHSVLFSALQRSIFCIFGKFISIAEMEKKKVKNYVCVIVEFTQWFCFGLSWSQWFSAWESFLLQVSSSLALWVEISLMKWYGSCRDGSVTAALQWGGAACWPLLCLLKLELPQISPDSSTKRWFF